MYGKFKTRLDAFWRSYISPIFSYNPFLGAKSFQFMNFSEAMFYKNNLASDFHTNTVISSLFAHVCLLVKMASETVIRPIAALFTLYAFHLGSVHYLWGRGAGKWGNGTLGTFCTPLNDGG